MNTRQEQRLAQGTLVSGRYRVKEVLGSGGFATVYEVEHVHLLTPFALKVLDLPVDPHASQSFSMRFVQEAQFAAKIRHPNVVQTTDYGIIEQTGQPFLIMEKLIGRDLDDELKAQGALETARALRLFDGCLAAIQRGHEMGIVHKDLKPSNLFLVEPETPDERLIVLDFGIARAYTDPDAKLTHTQNIAGTPAYLAPEYIQSQEVSPALDVYQMGLIIAESLMGVHPMDADTAMAYLMKHCMGQFELSAQLAQSPLGPILQRALSLDPADRWKDAGELRKALSLVDPLQLEPTYILSEEQRKRRRGRGLQSKNMVAQTNERDMSSGVFGATVAAPIDEVSAERKKALASQDHTVPGVVPQSLSSSSSSSPAWGAKPFDASQTSQSGALSQPLDLSTSNASSKLVDSTMSAELSGELNPYGASPPSTPNTLRLVGLAVFIAVLLAAGGVGLALMMSKDKKTPETLPLSALPDGVKPATAPSEVVAAPIKEEPVKPPVDEVEPAKSPPPAPRVLVFNPDEIRVALENKCSPMLTSGRSKNFVASFAIKSGAPGNVKIKGSPKNAASCLQETLLAMEYPAELTIKSQSLKLTLTPPERRQPEPKATSKEPEIKAPVIEQPEVKEPAVKEPPAKVDPPVKEPEPVKPVEPPVEKKVVPKTSPSFAG